MGCTLSPLWRKAQDCWEQHGEVGEHLEGFAALLLGNLLSPHQTPDPPELSLPMLGNGERVQDHTVSLFSVMSIG